MNVTIPFNEASSLKVGKYAPLANTLRVRGYEFQVHIQIVGALDAWNPNKEPVLTACSVSPPYAWLMKQLMVSDDIRWSRDIYTECITGHRQYQDA